MSTWEIAQVRGRSDTWADTWIRTLWRQGKVGVAYRDGVDRTGRPSKTPVYYRKAPA